MWWEDITGTDDPITLRLRSLALGSRKYSSDSLFFSWMLYPDTIEMFPIKFYHLTFGTMIEEVSTMSHL